MAGRLPGLRIGGGPLRGGPPPWGEPLGPRVGEPLRHRETGLTGPELLIRGGLSASDCARLTSLLAALLAGPRGRALGCGDCLAGVTPAPSLVSAETA